MLRVQTEDLGREQGGGSGASTLRSLTREYGVEKNSRMYKDKIHLCYEGARRVWEDTSYQDELKRHVVMYGFREVYKVQIKGPTVNLLFPGNLLLQP